MRQASVVVAAILAALAPPAWAGRMVQSGRPDLLIKPYEDAALQDIVTWDQHSIFVRGERIMLFNGEFHPYRLPVPALWLDIFQKLKAVGFSGVSFYTDWALYEGRQGAFVGTGVFNLTEFFAAASEAGIYLVARPGPYINAESSGGGFPGWLQRYKAIERTPDYLPLTENYVKHISHIIGAAQITNGGPVILLQPENEYTGATSNVVFPNHEYFAGVEKLYRDNGIVVPFVSNDASPNGNFAPGTGLGAVDIYGHDGYPLGFDCANPYTWPDGNLPTDYYMLHEKESPSTPYTISEFQGGSFDPWGGEGFHKCAELLNDQFERVFYKNNYGAGVTIFNLYMVYGGTNWGNLGHPGGYTSYDYGAMIAEDRSLMRQKYSEIKLQTNFFKVSPAYLTATASTAGNGLYVSTQNIATTLLKGNGTNTNIYVVRQAAYNSEGATQYKLDVPTSKGNVSIPQLSGNLTLFGRDSKLHVTDYSVGKFDLLYSSAEIFTWKQYGARTVLLLYGGSDETHEAAFPGQQKPSIVDGSGVTIGSVNGSIVLNWEVTLNRKVVKFPSGLYVYLLDRQDAYNYWVLDLPASAPVGNFTHQNATSVIVQAGYLLRTAGVSGNTLALTGDLNATAPLEIIGGAPANAQVTFNSQHVKTSRNSFGIITGNLSFVPPIFSIPSLTSLTWKYLNSLPEIQQSYSDAQWVSANHPTTNNTVRNLTTPTSLYGSDYGFNTGIILTRGHFTANGNESTFTLQTQGGTAFASSAWLDGTYLGSWYGNSAQSDANKTFTLSGKLVKGSKHIITIVSDNMGLDEDGEVGTDGNKDPRGVLDYELAGHPQSDLSWKITGNLGGEHYADISRGPLNEGGTYAERQGYHLPGAPASSWTTQSPFEGIASPGIAFYATTFDLHAPPGYDIPLSFQFANTTQNTGTNYRVQLFVNGWQYGKYVNNIGPQTLFPVPRGILNYEGSNYVAMTLWAMDTEGAKLGPMELVPTAKIHSAYPDVDPVPALQWSKRSSAY